MKASEFRKFYLTFKELYGVIDSDEAFKIIKKWYPDLKKNQLLKDLKDRSEKYTRDYMVRKVAKSRQYIIQNEFISDETIGYIFQNAAGKSYYVCDDLEEYWNFGKFGIPVGESSKSLHDLFIKKGYDEIKTEVALMLLYGWIRNAEDFNEPIQRLFDKLDPENENEARKIMDAYVKFQSGVRLYENAGHTPEEMRNMMPPVDINNVEMELGSNIRNILLDGEIDPEEMLEAIKNDDNIPETMKLSLIKQLDEIIILKKTEGKA